MTTARPRARDLGIDLLGTPGTANAITDVPGLEVGYATLIDGEGALTVGRGPVRTGVTAILPRGREGVGRPCAAGRFSLNGNGEMTGSAWIDEVGEVALPITISSTHAVGACHTGVIEWIGEHHPVLARQWLLPVCAETWDGYLNDINGGHVTPAVVRQALDAVETNVRIADPGGRVDARFHTAVEREHERGTAVEARGPGRAVRGARGRLPDRQQRAPLSAEVYR